MNRAAWIQQQHGRKAVLYVVRVYNEGEAFFKVGVTFCLSSRFSRLKTCYKWRTVARYSSGNAGKVFDLEQRLHTEFSSFSYLPTADFGGRMECYSEVEAILKALPKTTFFLKPVGDIL
jgi:hypothetical protein